MMAKVLLRLILISMVLTPIAFADTDVIQGVEPERFVFWKVLVDALHQMQQIKWTPFSALPSAANYPDGVIIYVTGYGWYENISSTSWTPWPKINYGLSYTGDGVLNVWTPTVTPTFTQTPTPTQTPTASNTPTPIVFPTERYQYDEKVILVGPGNDFVIDHGFGTKAIDVSVLVTSTNQILPFSDIEHVNDNQLIVHFAAAIAEDEYTVIIRNYTAYSDYFGDGASLTNTVDSTYAHNDVLAMLHDSGNLLDAADIKILNTTQYSVTTLSPLGVNAGRLGFYLADATATITSPTDNYVFSDNLHTINKFCMARQTTGDLSLFAPEYEVIDEDTSRITFASPQNNLVIMVSRIEDPVRFISGSGEVYTSYNRAKGEVVVYQKTNTPTPTFTETPTPTITPTATPSRTFPPDPTIVATPPLYVTPQNWGYNLVQSGGTNVRSHTVIIAATNSVNADADYTCTGDDLASIMAQAMDDVKDAEMGHIRLLDGHYSAEAVISVTYSNIAISGDGMDVTVIRRNFSNIANEGVITVQPGAAGTYDSFELSGVTIDGASGTVSVDTDDDGLLLTSVDNVRISNVRITNCYGTGLHWSGSTTDSSHRTVENCVVDTCNQYGYLDEGDNISYANCTGDGNAIANWKGGTTPENLQFANCLSINSQSNGYEYLTGDNLVFNGCIARNNDGIGFTVADAQLNGCVAEGNGGAGMTLRGACAVNDGRSANNTGDGISVIQGANNTVKGVDISDNGSEGFYSAVANARPNVIDCDITGNLVGIFLSNPATGTIKLNRIYENDQEGITIGNGAVPYPGRLEIANNRIWSNGWEELEINNITQVQVDDNLFEDNNITYDAIELIGSTRQSDVFLKGNIVRGNHLSPLYSLGASQTTAPTVWVNIGSDGLIYDERWEGNNLNLDGESKIDTAILGQATAEIFFATQAVYASHLLYAPTMLSASATTDQATANTTLHVGGGTHQYGINLVGGRMYLEPSSQLYSFGQTYTDGGTPFWYGVNSDGDAILSRNTGAEKMRIEKAGDVKIATGVKLLVGTHVHSGTEYNITSAQGDGGIIADSYTQYSQAFVNGERYKDVYDIDTNEQVADIVPLAKPKLRKWKRTKDFGKPKLEDFTDYMGALDEIITAQEQFNEAMQRWNVRNARPDWNEWHYGFIVEECPQFTSDLGAGIDLMKVVVDLWQEKEVLQTRLDAIEARLDSGGL